MSSKIIFNNLGHTGKPDLKKIYGIILLPSYGRASIVGFGTTWPTATALPTSQWYIDFAAQVPAPLDSWVMLDLESFDVSTQAARIATSAKFVTIYQSIKALRPELKIAFYQYPIIRDFYNAIDATNSSTYIAWQASNTDFATMAAVVDAYMPSVYSLDGADPGVQNGGTNYFHLYANAQIQEARRLRATYGRADQGIYPFTYWRSAGLDAVVPQWVYDEMTTTSYTAADGFVLFGGSGHTWTDATYGETAAWWQSILTQINSNDPWGQNFGTSVTRTIR